MPPPRRTALLLLLAGLAAWVANAILQWQSGAVLGHDEAQYAIAARDLLDGEPVRWNYLSTGMNLIAAPGVLAGGGELALRLVPVVLGVGFVLVAAHLARQVIGPLPAAWAVAVLAASVSMAKRASELLSDLPAATCLLAGTAILVEELAREGGIRRRLWLTAPCFAAAFYIRYGSLLALAVIGVVALAVGWRAILRRPLVVLATIATFGVLLVPFFRTSAAITGSPLGILRESSDVLGDTYLGESLVKYVTANPFTYYGFVTVPALLAGLVAIRRARDRRVLLLWLMAVADIIVVGLTPVAQARYIFFGLAILVVLGTGELYRLACSLPPRGRRAAAALAGAAIAASWIVVALSSIRLSESRSGRMAHTLAAVAAIRTDAAGAPCQVIGRHTTQLQWYTGCLAVYEAAPDTLARERVYLVREPGGQHQPELAGRPGTPRTILERPGALLVVRLDP